MTLRRRLVATMIVLVAVGLVVVDLITFTSLHSFLVRPGRRPADARPASQMAAFVPGPTTSTSP